MSDTDLESPNEAAKRSSRGLRSNIVEELQNDLPKFTHEAELTLKFHGIYTQDNRDVRSERKRAGLDVEHICMIRVAIPAGRLNPEQYLAVDKLADMLGNETLRVTTRQGIQFHFVTKSDLKTLLRAVNDVLLTTYAGCGDVVRNVTACPSPISKIEDLGLGELADAISRRYKPASSAYYEIWVDGEKVADRDLGQGVDEPEPLYGVTYLPRKFKIGLAPSSDNCIDVLSHDLGLVLDEESRGLIRVFVGGGLGKSHSDETTKALLAQPLTLATRENVFEIMDAVIGIQRDYGNRVDRSHARLKYLVEEWGIERFRQELASRLGFDLPEPEAFSFERSLDHLGWMEQNDGTAAYGIKVPSGRIADKEDAKYKSAIRELVRRFDLSVRLSAKEDVILTGIPSNERKTVLGVLANHGVREFSDYDGISRSAFACPALPTCGLALAESERFLPTFVGDLHEAVTELGIDNEDIEVRMTGCPNGCARPYLAEIGIVGRSKRSYDIYLGADRAGNRLGEIYAIDIANDSLVEALRPALSLYKKESLAKESFGDFCNRYSVTELKKFAPPPRRKRLAVTEAE